MGPRNLLLIGPVIFAIIGLAMLLAGIIAPADAKTDDGYPLDTFLMLMGGGFTAMGALWFGGTITLLRSLERQKAETQSRKAWLRQHGLLIQARVVAVDSNGYMNFDNEVWSDLLLEYEAPGVPRQYVARHLALPQQLLDLARAGG